MPVNRERLIEVAAWAAGEDAKRRLGLPSEWHQGTWLARQGCGTTCCIAGKVALDDGCTPLWTLVEKAAYVETPDYRMVHVSDYARGVLGLTGDQATFLFNGTRDLDGVLRTVGEILDEDEDEE